ncbi:MAG: SRPBCC family protein [Acidimicrobiales bacterium]
MTTVPLTATHSAVVTATPDEVWERMRDFGDLDWAEGIAEVRVDGTGVGTQRRVRLDGSDDWVVERLIELDDTDKSLRYAIEGAGIPGLSYYVARAEARPGSDGTEITWSCSAAADENTRETMQGMIDAMMHGIVSLFAAQFDPADTDQAGS